MGGPFKSDTVRAALAADPTISDEALIQHVNEVHGEDPKNVQTVPRTRRRIEDKRKKKASLDGPPDTRERPVRGGRGAR
ncbi:hypothetical protein [Streptomyces sp. NPDC048496]|uniref:hypothetical protein n=1 Tax=Streptomyces sp. NPDC048496 TaxID=3365558 RepID=UPI003712EEA0